MIMNIAPQKSISEKNWYIYPNGLKQMNNSSFLDSQDIMNDLGYNEHEYYLSYHDEHGMRIDTLYTKLTDAVIIPVWELFTNKLICIIRTDDKLLTQEELDNCNYKPNEWESSFGIDREIETLLCIEESIKEGNGIRKEFVMKVFNCSNFGEDRIKVKPYDFEFDRRGFLASAKVYGYDVLMINDFSYDGIVAYNKYANKHGHINGDIMKDLINYQYKCSEQIDGDIILSKISQEKFSYTQETYCINYIAMAAFYKQCDVNLKFFLLSTDGEYEILSKISDNGVTITKIRAYHELFKFYNEHSMPESIMDDSDNMISSECGYVYVMINPSLEGMVKIGKTTRDPNERVKELSSATGVPTPFILIYYKKFNNCHLAEEMIHQLLQEQGYRVSDNREFFKMSPTDAIRVIQDYYDEVEC